jgi:uncharacterized DUF497 family protein
MYPGFVLGGLRFVWDPAKHVANVQKHGITFEEAATTWLDPLAVERPDEEHSRDEQRWLRMGMSLRGVLLVVWSAEGARAGEVVIRLIGARRATPRERRIYESEGREDGPEERGRR